MLFIADGSLTFLHISKNIIIWFGVQSVQIVFCVLWLNGQIHPEAKHAAKVSLSKTVKMKAAAEQGISSGGSQK